MWMLIEILLTVLELTHWWRLVLCCAAAALLCALIWAQVENKTFRKVLCAPIVLTAVIGGGIWEIRNNNKP